MCMLSRSLLPVCLSVRVTDMDVAITNVRVMCKKVAFLSFHRNGQNS